GAVFSRGGALNDEPFGSPPAFARLGLAPAGLAQRAVGLRARLLGAPQLGCRALVGVFRGALGLSRLLGGGDQPVALVATREHALAAPLRQLSHLARRREPHAALARCRDAGEVPR